MVARLVGYGPVRQKKTFLDSTVSFEICLIWRNLARDVSHFGSTRRTEAPHSKKSPNCPRLPAARQLVFQLFGPDLRIKQASYLVETTQVSKQAITCRMTSLLGQIPNFHVSDVVS